jgi:hypothetical protein
MFWLRGAVDIFGMIEKSYEHHIRVVLSAIRGAKDNGLSLHAVHLSQLELPYYHAWEVPDLSALSESLRELLEHIMILRLSRSDSPLELLSHSTLNLHQFDMCYLTVRHASLKDFLETNAKSIRSIGFHDVRLTGMNQQETELPELPQNCFVAR